MNRRTFIGRLLGLVGIGAIAQTVTPPLRTPGEFILMSKREYRVFCDINDFKAITIPKAYKIPKGYVKGDLVIIDYRNVENT